MSYEIETKQVPFTQLYNKIIEDPTISYKAKGLYSYIQSKPPLWQFYLSDIVNHSTDGKKAVQSGLKELESAGYLMRKQEHKPDGSFGGVKFFLSYDKVFSPCTHLAHTQNGVDAKSGRQSNTNLLSNTKCNSDTHTKESIIVDAWDSMFSVESKRDVALMNRIKSFLNNYTFDIVKETIIKYHIVVTGEKYFYTKGTTIFDFFSNGEYKFTGFYHKDLANFESYGKQDKQTTQMKAVVNGRLQAV